MKKAILTALCVAAIAGVAEASHKSNRKPAEATGGV